MTANTEQLVASLEPLTLHSLEAFCEDIASMFGNAAECTADSTGQGNLSDLKKEFKKLASVNQVQTLGVLDGTFQLLLDQAGLFVLAGVFVMLPEKRILETIRNGTLQDADYINDAIKEVGNLLVGSWDRIFREELQGHKHLKQTNTFVGSIWDNPAENIGLNLDQPCRYVICRMKVDEFPEFKCAAIFSEDLFAAPMEPDAEQPPASVENTSVDPEPQPEPQPEPEKPAELVAADSPEPAASQAAPSEKISDDIPLPEPAETPTAEETVPAQPAPPAVQQHGPVSEAIRQLTQQAADVCNRRPEVKHGLELPVLSVGQIMNHAVLWVDPEDTIEDVLRQMQQQNVGYALAGREGQIEGLISRSDIAAAISPYTRSAFAHWRRPLDDATLQIRIKWFMSRPVHTIQPDASLIIAIEKMMRHAVRGIPVVDANAQTLGFVTVYDVFGALLDSAGVGIVGRPQQAPPGVQ